MRVPHDFCADFDDDNLIGVAGLAPVMRLAESTGLTDLVAEFVSVASSAGANPTKSPFNQLQFERVRWRRHNLLMARRFFEGTAPNWEETWRDIRRLRSTLPSAIPTDRHELFSSALEQAEQQFRAAERVDYESRPLNLFYGLAQAGRAISAALTPQGADHRLRGHGLAAGGLDHLENPALLFDLTIRGGGRSNTSYAHLASLFDSDSLDTPISLGAVYSMLPEVYLDHPLDGYVQTQLVSKSYGADDSIDFPLTEDESSDNAAEVRTKYPQLKSAKLIAPSGSVREDDSGERVPLWQLHLTDLSRSLSNYRGSLALMPAAPGGGFLDPLLAWWVMLYTLSMVSRYQPVLWTRAINVDRSEIAVPLETIMDKALEAVPAQIYFALERVPRK